MQEKSVILPEEIKESLKALTREFNDLTDRDKHYITMIPATFYLISLIEDAEIASSELSSFSSGMTYVSDFITRKIHTIIKESEKLVRYLEEAACSSPRLPEEEKSQ